LRAMLTMFRDRLGITPVLLEEQGSAGRVAGDIS